MPNKKIQENTELSGHTFGSGDRVLIVPKVDISNPADLVSGQPNGRWVDYDNLHVANANVDGLSALLAAKLALAGGTMTGNILFSGTKGPDTTATGGSDILPVGGVNADEVRLGRTSSLVTTIPKFITLNRGGSAAAMVGAGFYVEGDGDSSAWLLINDSGTGFSLKSGVFNDPVEFDFSETGADAIYTFPAAGGTLITTGNLGDITSLGTQSASTLYASGHGPDVVGTGSTDVLDIGTTNADVINYGHTGTIHNFYGSTVYQNVTQLQVTDPLITLNKGGSTASGGGSGFEIEENSSSTGYFKQNGPRTGFSLKASANSYSATFLTTGFGADAIFTLPPTTDTLVGMDATQNLSNKIYNGVNITNATNSFTIANTGASPRTITFNTVSQTIDQVVGTAGSPSFGALTITGTAGTGFLSLINQSFAPAAVAGTLRIYSDNSTRLNLVRRNVGGTADITRTFSFPDANWSGTFAGDFTTAGAFALTLTSTATTNVTLPTTGTLATLAGSETFTNKTITGGTHTAVTSFGLRDTGASFDLFLAAAGTGTSANRTLTLDVANASRTLKISANVTLDQDLQKSATVQFGIIRTANSGNITMSTTGSLQLGDGSGGTATDSTNILAFYTGAGTTPKFSVNATTGSIFTNANLTVNGTFSISALTLTTISATGGAGNPLTITGNVGIGGAPLSNLHVVSESTGYPRGVMNSQHSTTADKSALFIFRRSKGSYASPTALTDGYIIGTFFAQGYIDDYRTPAGFGFVVDGTPSGAALPTSFYIGTSTNGDTGGTNRFFITPGGNVGIGNFGIASSGTTPGYVLDVIGDINSSTLIRVAGNQVIGPRATGWTAGTGTHNKGAYDSETATALDVARRLYSLEAALRTHGSIGT